MTQNKINNKKILLLGVDGMDPRLTKKYVSEGKMPNVQKFIECGSQREDLMMLGGHPTVTPAMWTTLATGAYANVHGITGYFRKGNELDELDYNFDSRDCRAEPLWNATAEAGLKTLVWHWPGSSWPPTSDNPNLMVVDGTGPGPVGAGILGCDTEFVVSASEKIEQVQFIPKAEMEARQACVVDNVDISGKSFELDVNIDTFYSEDIFKALLWKESQFTYNASEARVDQVLSPIKEATGWVEAPTDAKEFTVLYSGGLIRRPALILKNKETGKYDSVAIYKRKKDAKPIAVCPLGEMVKSVIDEAVANDEVVEALRHFKLLRIAKDGSSLNLFISAALKTDGDSVWHPKRLFHQIKENIGSPVPGSGVAAQDDMLISECLLDTWDVACQYQADCLLHLIESENLDIVFSHMHNIDAAEHLFIKHLADRPFNRQPVEVAQKWMQLLYEQTDRYLGRFLHLLDEGWTIFVFSDHGQVASAHKQPLLIDINGLTTPVMEEMGYTVLKRNENGEKIGEIDWTKTKAILQRDGHIYLNIRGRDKHTLEDGSILDGIVEPEDQYELEEEIITKLYQLTDSETGHRVISVALRNKDAILLGMGGPNSGDICIWHAEGYNYDHADSLSTTCGESSTSVSPMFIAAGPGIKINHKTERIIRQVDFAPTVATLLGVRMPEQCEGAPIYQILL